ncbi:3-oxoadipate enol-lactonase 2 [Pigmentiphaga humi]|uniref:3-oxoadipate enol-lactonase 2 n=1 Tax=Pigmentiphaga humi TaxID=2478468 RepID=A0A3P4B618_9BURK|nr:alpha/beta hydrolase [Pigmentiphaga humi]VCU71754.1 3-oxoadipate enol-lactonase 2 [Pigmentiphaga humi]
MDQYIEVNGIRMRYRVEGRGDWLVLIHGVGGRLEQWDQFVSLLGGGYRTLRFDQRGMGETSKPEGPYRVDDFVADAHALMEAVGAERCVLAGVSLGALVAQGYALAHPGKLDKLILLAGIAGRTDEEKRRVQERLSIVAEGIPGQHFENSVDRWFTDEFRARHPEIIAAYAASNRKNDPKAYAAAYAVLANTDFADRLHEIKVPTLIVTGEHDKGSNPRMAHFMHDRIAGSQVHILPRLRHSLLIEGPRQVLDVVEPFLRA